MMFQVYLDPEVVRPDIPYAAPSADQVAKVTSTSLAYDRGRYDVRVLCSWSGPRTASNCMLSASRDPGAAV
jgi:hypothetical protein